MAIKENIKKLREIYGLSQKDLAEIGGVSDKAVSTWENGIKEPRMGVIQKIADHFGFMKSNLIEDNGMNEVEMIFKNKECAPVIVFTEFDVSLVNRFHNLSSLGQTMIMDMLNNLEKMEKRK
jgi:transcriptional regulator with XRE-family HTH domain